MTTVLVPLVLEIVSDFLFSPLHNWFLEALSSLGNPIAMPGEIQGRRRHRRASARRLCPPAELHSAMVANGVT
jgi:hypothetical protein